mgnify:CR=1 FL=1
MWLSLLKSCRIDMNAPLVDTFPSRSKIYGRDWNPDNHHGAYRVSGFFMRKALLHPNYGGACGGVVRLAGFHGDR